MIALALAAILGAAPGGPALPDAVFTGVFVTTYPDGRFARLWLDRDGGYRAEGRRKDASSGRWSVKGTRTCFRQSRPIPVPISVCAAMPDQLGKRWTTRAVTGETVRVQLVDGR